MVLSLDLFSCHIKCIRESTGLQGGVILIILIRIFLLTHLFVPKQVLCLGQLRCKCVNRLLSRSHTQTFSQKKRAAQLMIALLRIWT